MTARIYGRPTFEIGGRPVGPGKPCYVIAEAGSNHNGDIDTAKRLIDAAAEAGADAVKFQTYTAEGLYSRKTPNPSYLKKASLLKSQETVWELIKRVEIPWEWHEELAAHTASTGLHFLSSPVRGGGGRSARERQGACVQDRVVRDHPPAPDHLRAKTGKPLLISTGMASLADIERALDVANDTGCDQVALLHCAINYPPAVRRPEPASDPDPRQRVPGAGGLVGPHDGAQRRRRRRGPRRLHRREALHARSRPGGPRPRLRARAARAGRHGAGHPRDGGVARAARSSGSPRRSRRCSASAAAAWSRRATCLRGPRSPERTSR